ncbi:hypothetical protein [Litchfieldia salsa]|uniref:Uncharacterized protein n=1 Tax=Litchfieldia salsa TaxID=930152 RepID=A0A1H0RRF3_9BACI|nr:hypothetical protein [Litchfieldia salsa]SDP31556.1 hypothetical protein SAMN05216565_102330 [Litchfieldia salsa]
MYMLFNVERYEDKIRIVKQSDTELFNISLYIDQFYLGSISYLNDMSLNLPYNYADTLIIKADILSNGYLYSLTEQHPIRLRNHHETAEISYKPGDILVACDNVNGLPYGYMGHSVIAVDSTHGIEAIPIHPIIRKVSITSFKNDHPKHVVIRPNSSDVGKKAAEYAKKYLDDYNKEGTKKPKFKFTLSEPLDENEFIYCSKLVWMAYYFGAGIEFKNDHLWFAPEDLYTKSLDHPDFEIVESHPDFAFKVDL